MDDLSKLEKEILKKLIVDQSRHGYRWSIGYILGLFPSFSYKDKEILKALERMEGKYIQKRADNYFFTQDQFIEVYNKFKWWIRLENSKKSAKRFWDFIWKHFIVTIITAAVTAVIVTYIRDYLRSKGK